MSDTLGSTHPERAVIEGRGLRSVLDVAGVAMATLDTEGHVRTATGAFASLFGLDRSDLVGLHLIGVLPAHDRPELLARLVRVIDGAASIEHLDVALVGATSSLRPKRLTIGRVLAEGRSGAGDEPTELVAVLTDPASAELRGSTPVGVTGPGGTASASGLGPDSADVVPMDGSRWLRSTLSAAIRRSSRSGRAFTVLRIDPGLPEPARSNAPTAAFVESLTAQLRPQDHVDAVDALGVVVVAEDLGDAQDAAGIAYRALSAAVEPIGTPSGPLRCTPTVGVVVADGTAGIDRLLDAARSALDSALADGAGGFRILDLRPGVAA